MGATAVTPAAPPRRGPLGGVSARLLRVASDEKLVAAVRQGSQPAFEVVYDRHHRGILSFCRHMLSSREEAEDAVQHTFMAAYKALMGSDKDIQLKAWLYTIARNRCLSVLRARREHASDEIEIASFHGLAAEVEQRAELQDLLRDLSELPEDQRAALVLSEIGDLGHDEIGRVLDVPKDKVKALVFQARSSLQQSRDARETSCEEIREMLATLSGGALRRTTLRRHVKDCAGCQAFESEVKRQRRAMAAVLPVVPTIGLKENALAAAFGQSAAGGAAVAGGAAAAGSAAGGSVLAGGGVSAVVAKVLVVATVAGGGAAGVSAVSGGGERPDRSRSAPAGEPSRPSSPQPPAAVAPAATAEAQEQADKVEEEKPRKSKKGREGDRGKELAKSRGKGKKNGLNGTQPGQTKDAKEKKAKKAKKEKAEEKAVKRKARAKSRQQKARAKAKSKTRERIRRQRPAKQQAKQPKPKTEEQQQQQQPQSEKPKPDPTPEPTPTVVPDVTPDDGKDKDK